MSGAAPSRPKPWLIGLIGLLVACANPERDLPTGTGRPAELEIVEVQTPGDLMIGSLVSVVVRGLALTGDDILLDVRSADGLTVSSLAAAHIRTTTEIEFLVSSSAYTVFGLGSHEISLTVIEGERTSDTFADTWTLVDSVGLRLLQVPSGGVFRNDVVVLSGDGFLTPEEATVEAELTGTFTPQEGRPVAVAVRLPVEPAERFARDRGLLRLTTAIGGQRPGSFEGTVEVTALAATGVRSASGDHPLTLRFLSPTLFELSPDDPALGQLVTLRGGGFLGSPDEPDEATLLRVEGTFTTEERLELTFGPAEAVLVYESGQRALWGLEIEVRGSSLVSEFFGYRRGSFAGDATLITIKGTEEVIGDPTPVQLELAGVRQVVHISFLPGFFDSLRHFGLSAAALELRERVRDRMQSIYADYNVLAVLDAPRDFLPSAYARVDIGGPDPNGLGLLGYDNTPGKDVGNVRLFDTIGGANAETQADGFPGFGGVFIDSFLYWSEEPGFSGERPFGAPPPDPLFDAIFGPVRAEAATLEEVEGSGDPDRVARVERAVSALGNMVGETAAHEVGHSLGLAQPFGPEDAFHSPFPGEGCLMDSGADRPLGERSGEPGYAETHFCFQEPEYLGQILPK